MCKRSSSSFARTSFGIDFKYFGSKQMQSFSNFELLINGLSKLFAQIYV